MKRFFSILRLYIGLMRVANNPNNTAAALAIAERLRELGLIEAEERKLMSDPESALVIKKRKTLGPIDLQKLNKLPEGSLGKVYSSHMLKLGLNPEFFKNIEIVDGITLGMMRLRQTHDLWHVMTGFDTSVPGELGLQAFMLAQTDSPLSPLLIGGRLFAVAVKDPSEVPLIFESVTHGWILGKNSKPLFPIDWEANWETPLQEMQSKYISYDKMNFETKSAPSDFLPHTSKEQVQENTSTH